MTYRVKSKGVRVHKQKKNSHTALTDFFLLLFFYIELAQILLAPLKYAV